MSEKVVEMLHHLIKSGGSLDTSIEEDKGKGGLSLTGGDTHSLDKSSRLLSYSLRDISVKE